MLGRREAFLDAVHSVAAPVSPLPRFLSLTQGERQRLPAGTVASEMLLQEFPWLFIKYRFWIMLPVYPMRASVLDGTLAQALSVTTK